jgi:hypothetical protein
MKGIGEGSFIDVNVIVGTVKSINYSSLPKSIKQDVELDDESVDEEGVGDR